MAKHQSSYAKTPAGIADLGATALILVAAGLAFLLFPGQLGLLTRIAILAMLALSLDLVTGYARIVTLGQAAPFGIGAYAAGLCAVHGGPDPLLGAAIGTAAGSCTAFLSGMLILRARGLTALMLTILAALALQQVALIARNLTGGADGLGDIAVTPLLGFFDYDFVGKTAYFYAIAALALTFLFARRLVASPFGLSIRAAGQNPKRVTALGASVYWRQVAIYSIAGALAGLAGALMAQSSGVVSPEVFDFALSAEVLVMLVLGGAGRLWGGLIGAVLFVSVRHIASGIDPFNWLFAIGALLLVVVFVAPGGIVSLSGLLKRRLGQ